MIFYRLSVSLLYITAVSFAHAYEQRVDNIEIKLVDLGYDVQSIARQPRILRPNCGEYGPSAYEILRPTLAPPGYEPNVPLAIRRQSLPSQFTISHLASRSLPPYPIHVRFFCTRKAIAKGDVYSMTVTITSFRISRNWPDGVVYDLPCAPGYSFAGIRFTFIEEPPKGFDLNKTPFALKEIIPIGNGLQIRVVNFADRRLPPYPGQLSHYCIKKTS